MEQDDLIPHLLDIDDTKLIGAEMYSQLTNLSPRNISIGPFEIRSLFFEQRQMRRDIRL